MSLIQFLRILLARWKLILASMLACTVVAALVAGSLPKRYPATARVLLDIGKPDIVTGQVISGRDRSYTRTQIELVKDMRVAGAAVDRLGMASNPDTIAAYQRTGRSEADGGIRAWLAQRISNNTSARLVSASAILEITYQASTPEQAKEVVSVIRESYVDESLRFRTDSATRSGDWYREQAEKSREALIAAEAALADYMREHDIMIVGGQDSETAKLNALQASLQQARGTQSSTDAVVATRVGNDPVVQRLETQLATIDDELAFAQSRLGAEHPQFKALQARRSTVAAELSRANARAQSTVSTMSSVAQQSVAKLEAQVAEQEKIVLDRKPVLDEFVRINHDVMLKREQYQKAASMTDNLRLQADVSEAGMVILGDPVASNTPSYPKFRLVVVMALLFGTGLGLVTAILAEFLARRVRGQEDLAFASGVPVLVTVRSVRPGRLRQRARKLLGYRFQDRAGHEPQVV